MHGISAIVVTWNSGREIRGCLRSLTRSLHGVAHEVILVDNNSTDFTCQTVVHHFPSVCLIRNTINWGFGQGNNIGIRKSRGEYILLLNPDTIVNKQSIKGMIAYLDTHPDVGAVGPEQVDATGRMLFTASRLSLRGVSEYLVEQTVSLIVNKQKILFPAPYPVPYLNAGCVLVRRSALPPFPYFDPKLFIYGEEFDFFPKVRRAGWHIVFLRNLPIRHDRGESINPTGKKLSFALRSFSYLIKRRLFRLPPASG
ncbi:MAG: glycosyltransferase family 2 protein [Patescibacteria group bacterium]